MPTLLNDCTTTPSYTMHHGGSKSGTPRHSMDGHYTSPRMSSSRPGTPQLGSAAAYPVYVNPPASISAATDMDYDYDERDLARPCISVQFSESSRSGPHSHRSAPASLPTRGYSWDPSHGHSHTPQSPASPSGYPSGQQHANPYSHKPFPGSYPDQQKETYWYAEPPSSSPSSQSYFPGTSPGHDADSALFGITAPHHHPGHYQTWQGEVLPSFPHWSRTWYDGHLSAHGYACSTAGPPHSGQSGWESDTLSGKGAIPGSYGNVYGRSEMTDVVKEERIRMLEKEFGRPKIMHKSSNGRGDMDDDIEAEVGEDDNLPLGSVTSTGRLITERPKWNMALRCLQGLVTLIACACGPGGVLFVKTTSDYKPAPKGTFPAYVLYACPVITLAALLYFHLFRAFCCDPMRKELQSGHCSNNPLGGMVIPIFSGGGAGGKMPKQKKYGQKMQQNQMPIVNFIVDPSLLSAIGAGKRDDSEDEERLPGDARRSSKRKHGLGVFGNMQMQRRWRLARKSMKLLVTLDVVLCIIWTACDVVTLGLGKRCPASTMGMWCTLYNTAMACGVILVILFAAAIFFDYRALRVSRHVPRPPM